MAARTTGFRRPFEPMRSRNEGLRPAPRDARIAASWPSTSISAPAIFANTPAAGKPGSGTKPSQQPMTSLFEQSLLLVGDAIAMSMVRKRDIDLDSLWEYHANLE